MIAAQRILVVTDDESDVPLFESLRRYDLEVVVDRDVRRGQERLRRSEFDLLIIDVGEISRAAELLTSARGAPELTEPLVLITAEWGTGQPAWTLSKGADAFEPKPLDEERLLNTVERILRPRMVMTTAANGDAGL